MYIIGATFANLLWFWEHGCVYIRILKWGKGSWIQEIRGPEIECHNYSMTSNCALRENINEKYCTILNFIKSLVRLVHGNRKIDFLIRNDIAAYQWGVKYINFNFQKWGHPAPLWNYVPGLSGYKNQLAKSAGVNGAKVPNPMNVVHTHCILFLQIFSAQPNFNPSKKHQSDIIRTGPLWLTQKSTICSTGVQV